MAPRLRLVTIASLTLAAGVSFTSCRRSEPPKVVIQPTPTPAPVATPPPPPYVPNKRLEVGKMFNGMHLRTQVETEFGTTATTERNTPESYAIDITVRVRVPKPHQSLEELAQLNPELPKVLP